MKDEDPIKKSFWQTLPGILTAVAAIITAITGLLIAFNQMGLFSRNSKEAQSINNTSSQKTHGNDAMKMPSSVDDKSNGQNVEVRFSMTDIKGKGGEHEYQILESAVEKKDPSISILKIKIRYTNNTQYGANFWNNGFRLSVDDVLNAPSGDLNEVVDGNASKDGIIQFEVPNDAEKLSLIIMDPGDKITVPLTIAKN